MLELYPSKSVTPAKAGVQGQNGSRLPWISACAGMTIPPARIPLKKHKEISWSGLGQVKLGHDDQRFGRDRRATPGSRGLVQL